MSTIESAKKIGNIVTHNFGGLRIECVIIDIKYAYGQERWLLKPNATWAANEVWINA